MILKYREHTEDKVVLTVVKSITVIVNFRTLQVDHCQINRDIQSEHALLTDAVKAELPKLYTALERQQLNKDRETSVKQIGM